MRPARRVEIDSVVSAVTAAAAVVAVAFFGLSQISRPAGLTQQLSILNQQTDKAERLFAAPSTSQNPDAICHQHLDTAVSDLKLRLQSAGTAPGLALTHMDASPGVGDEALEGITPITFSFTATGPYEAILPMLGRLANSRPQIFVDQMDLKSQTTAASVALTGRIFCSISARP